MLPENRIAPEVYKRRATYEMENKKVHDHMELILYLYCTHWAHILRLYPKGSWTPRNLTRRSWR